jgi:hypothetical protein
MARKQVNVFGASFLDLLAGALGAVIILYIIVPKLTQSDADALEQLNNLSVELNDLERILDEIDQLVSIEVIDEMRNQFDLLNSQIRNLESTLLAMQRELDEAREIRARLEQTEARLSELERINAEVIARVDAAEQAAAAANERAFEAEREAAAANAKADQLRMKHLDMLILIDITGSMGVAVAGLKKEISDVVKILDHISPSLGFGIIAYGDIRYQRPVTEFEIVDVGTSAGRRNLFRFIDSMHLEMGLGSGVNPELPEALHLAMERALVAGWRAQAEQRYIVIITDAPAYSNQVENVYRMVRQFNSERPYSFVSTVQVLDQRSYVNTQTILRRIAQLGGGNYVDTSSGEGFLTSFLLAILESS